MNPESSSLTKRILLKIWRLFPGWLQRIASRMIRPLFQVFAAAVILDEGGKFLLVKATYQRIHPWGLPGGSLEYGEHPEEAIRREVGEELSLKICIEKLLMVHTLSPDRVGFYYLCRITDGTFQPSDEVSECDYFSVDNLPDVHPADVEILRRLHTLIEHELA